MNGNATLDQLKDIHLPPPVGWWPPALGWWLLLIGLTILVIAVWFLKRHLRQSYRRAALRELRTLRENSAGIDDRQRLEQLAALLRRVAIQGCGREQVASLSGEAWLAFLDRSGKTDQFTSGAGRALGRDLYRAGIESDPTGIFSLVENWIRRHRSC